MILWDREDYLVEDYKQRNDEFTYVEVKYSNDKTLSDLIEKSNNFFKRLKKKKVFLERELKWFSSSFKNASCLGKIKGLGKNPEDAFLVTADVVDLYPSIHHDAGLKALYEKLEERSDKKVPSADLVDMIKFVLKNNFFEFDSKVKQHISETAIGTKFAPPYASIFMDKVEIDFLETQRNFKNF